MTRAIPFLLALASLLLGGCAFKGGPFGGPDPFDYAPRDDAPFNPVARTVEAGAFVVHVHGWKHAEPGRERGGAWRYAVVDVSVRGATDDARYLGTESFSLLAANGSVARNDAVVNAFLANALPRFTVAAANATLRGHVLFPVARDFTPATLALAPIGAEAVHVPLAPRGDDAPLPVEATPHRHAPGARATVGGMNVTLRALAPTTQPAFFEGFTKYNLTFTYEAARVEDARGLTMGFRLRGSDGYLYRPSEHETPPWWDGLNGEGEFEPGRAYDEVALMEAPASAAPFEVWFSATLDAPTVAWGPVP